ncbi:hypothetical protein [Caproiciproducens sp. CPB-2]|uniref:hypothetical protein n=1 Tax=Caproiciproducens sp. CPB-2 TaxID=3030017 RepID=UPI0023DC8BEE|nr:hypothetical protein [Caproiciproducens sp. CPB-2]MDF1496322.1 hypothetical protein [Caproiciproducens sp. CPB-2]
MKLQMQVEQFVKNNGIKKSYVASKCGLTPSDFSLWLHNKLYINPEIEIKISEFINLR